MSESESNPLPPRPVVVGVGGCSGSGKTSLARELAAILDGTHFPLDHYYRDLRTCHLKSAASRISTIPSMLESELLTRHIARSGQDAASIVLFMILQATVACANQTEYIDPGRFMLVDGIFALHYDALRPLYDLSIYVDTPDDVCFTRRLARDVRERGRTPESVAAQYATTVRPMAEKYVRPSAAYAELILDGTTSLDWSLEQVLAN